MENFSPVELIAIEHSCMKLLRRAITRVFRSIMELA